MYVRMFLQDGKRMKMMNFAVDQLLDSRKFSKYKKFCGRIEEKTGFVEQLFMDSALVNNALSVRNFLANERIHVLEHTPYGHIRLHLFSKVNWREHIFRLWDY